jgi:hypothetical protein
LKEEEKAKDVEASANESKYALADHNSHVERKLLKFVKERPGLQQLSNRLPSKLIFE